MPRFRIASLLVMAGVLIGLLYVGWLVVAQWPAGTLLEVQPVPRGDQEIAWIHLATSASTWERFIEGVHHARTLLKERQPPLDLLINDSGSFPQSSAAVPEVSLQIAGQGGRLWVRYYKLTSETNAGYWVRALAARQPAPIAILGGMSTDQARDLARALRAEASWQGPPPVFLIATATADRVAIHGGAEYAVPGAEVETEDLMDIYPRRSFRFCFTNSQMAQAVTRFIWSRPDLKPDAGPVYLVSWKDDPYSLDLTKQFYDCLWPDVDRPTSGRQPLVEAPGPPWKRLIPYSIGSYSRPNDRESEIADRLLDEISERQDQRQALLVLPAASQPARRFLRAMVQTAPTMVDRFTIATGDYIDFNSVCRDRNLAWPIQALPLRMVFFTHRNPVDPAAGFLAAPEATRSSTDDMLLYADIAETLTRAVLVDLKAAPAQGLNEVLSAVAGVDGQQRFDAKGNLRAGSSEYVTLLQPQRSEAGRVLPNALLQVFRRADDRGEWEVVQRLQLSYTGSSGRAP